MRLECVVAGSAERRKGRNADVEGESWGQCLRALGTFRVSVLP